MNNVWIPPNRTFFPKIRNWVTKIIFFQHGRIKTYPNHFSPKILGQKFNLTSIFHFNQVNNNWITQKLCVKDMLCNQCMLFCLKMFLHGLHAQNIDQKSGIVEQNFEFLAHCAKPVYTLLPEAMLWMVGRKLVSQLMQQCVNIYGYLNLQSTWKTTKSVLLICMSRNIRTVWQRSLE